MTNLRRNASIQSVAQAAREAADDCFARLESAQRAGSPRATGLTNEWFTLNTLAEHLERLASNA